MHYLYTKLEQGVKLDREIPPRNIDGWDLIA